MPSNVSLEFRPSTGLRSHLLHSRPSQVIQHQDRNNRVAGDLFHSKSSNKEGRQGRRDHVFPGASVQHRAFGPPLEAAA